MTSTSAPMKSTYRVRDRAGKERSGELQAESRSAVAQKLVQMGYAPLSVEPVKSDGMQTELRIPGLGDRVNLIN